MYNGRTSLAVLYYYQIDGEEHEKFIFDDDFDTLNEAIKIMKSIMPGYDDTEGVDVDEWEDRAIEALTECVRNGSWPSSYSSMGIRQHFIRHLDNNCRMMAVLEPK